MFVVDGEPCLFHGAQDGGEVGGSFVSVGDDDGGGGHR